MEQIVVGFIIRPVGGCLSALLGQLHRPLHLLGGRGVAGDRHELGAQVDHLLLDVGDAHLLVTDRGADGETLDGLLEDKNSLNADIAAGIRGDLETYGLEMVSVGVKDIILPGEMRTILNHVIEAQKRAEANLIRRREETAAARSQANTARLLAENPQLARMKELEALQEILKGAETTFVLGQRDVLTELAQVVTRSSVSGET